MSLIVKKVDISDGHTSCNFCHSKLGYDNNRRLIYDYTHVYEFRGSDCSVVISICKDCLNQLNQNVTKIEGLSSFIDVKNDDNIPEWLTIAIRQGAINTYNSHKTVEDRKRVHAIKIIRDAAEKSGYKITISKAVDIFNKFCLPFCNDGLL